jgi:dienelactone hydrolase
MRSPIRVFVCLCLLVPGSAAAQPVDPAQAPAIQAKLAELNSQVEALRQTEHPEALVHDVAVYAKAVEWILRHNEFYKPDYNTATIKALETGLKRAADLTGGKSPWDAVPGRTIRGYRSDVDESIQPYALSLPAEFGKEPEKRWPLHVVLHGRGDTLNEVSFIRQHDGKPAAEGQDWIQLDVFGRTNNAYRWAGEADVLEAFSDVRRRLRIDERRVVLRGFSMGGAGAWHLGLHYPSLWCSVGPGAGFVDFYKYQKVTTPLPPWQDAALHIYNPIDYAMNAANVPVITYGGDIDPQLAASKEMVVAAEKVKVPIKMLIGPMTGHKFHPDSEKEFMAFHKEQQDKGRDTYPGSGKVRFTTWTLKYNTCNWLTIEGMQKPYQPATMESELDEASGDLKVTTENVNAIAIARDLAPRVILDGQKFELQQAAEGLLPDVMFAGGNGSWDVMTYEATLAFPKNADRLKRHNLQGPIDDAFMSPFVCVRGTGTPWSAEHVAWANWTLERFQKEFDKGFRGQPPVTDDQKVNADLITGKHLILFGDPGSNSVIAQVVKNIHGVKWTKEGLEVNGQKYDPATHGLSLIYPNPMNPRKYIVINSGHTFHAEDFKKSNAWIFPRLGDIAVQKFERTDTGYNESIVWAEIFNGGWRLPAK